MVWVNKTHYPLVAPGMTNTFTQNKQLYLLRNPLDVILSVAHMCMTVSHDLVPKEQYHVDFPEFWDSWITKQINSMQLYHHYHMTTISQSIPTYCIRYEDLVSNPVAVLSEIFEFLFEVPSIKGTVCEARIKKVA